MPPLYFTHTYATLTANPKASLYEKDPQRAFFGSHYPQLKAIKDKYDAKDLFLVAEGVGSDKWDTSLNCHRN
jgi:hypothetical protein